MGLEGPLVSVIVVVLAFLPLGLLSEPNASGAPPEVPQPMNVVIESYNFYTSVHWNYTNIPSKPLFIVELKRYGGKDYMEVDTCVNISQCYCDLTRKIDPHRNFWVRVKAVAGLHESEYVSNGPFHIYTHVRIGPPKLYPIIKDHEIQVDIEHPLIPYHKKSPRTVITKLEDFTYKVFLWERGSQKKRQEFQPDPDNCTPKICTINLHIGFWNTSYCVSAKGISRMYSIIGKESEENCIAIPLKSSLDLTVAIICGVVALAVLVVILAILYKRLHKKKINLPKSLVAKVNNVSIFDTKSEGKYISVVTSSEKPESPEYEDDKLIDPIAEVKTTDVNGCVKEENVDDSQGTLSKAGEFSNQEGMVVEIPEGEQNPEDNVNYFKSVSGQEDMCNNLPILDLPRADMQQPTVLGSCIKVSGYDKPHWKSSDSGEELLIAQNPSDEPEA